MVGATVPPRSLTARVEKVVGRASVRWTTPDCGLSGAHRFSVQLEDGSAVFVKAATDDQTERWLRTEHLVLSTMATSFMPRVVAWLDEPGTRPILLSQDLSDAYWPASHHGVVWRDGDLDLLFAGIAQIAMCDGLGSLPELEHSRTPIWPALASNPTAFLELGVCSAEWLERSAAALTEAEARADLTGHSLIHGDIRSDNVCLAGSQAVFVDWSSAARGNGMYNLASVLASIHLEGGPPPYEVMPDGASWAAIESATLARRAIQDQTAPGWLQKVFRRLIVINLEWAANALGLPAPGGPKRYAASETYIPPARKMGASTDEGDQQPRYPPLCGDPRRRGMQ